VIIAEAQRVQSCRVKRAPRSCDWAMSRPRKTLVSSDNQVELMQIDTTAS
jgi:hypothetical protein